MSLVSLKLDYVEMSLQILTKELTSAEVCEGGNLAEIIFRLGMMNT